MAVETGLTPPAPAKLSERTLDHQEDELAVSQ